MRSITESHPPGEYPKLYPKPIENYDRFHRNYLLMNYVVLGLGLLLVGFFFVSDFSPTEKAPQVFPVLFFLLQMAPSILMELSEFSYFKLMRKADFRSTRMADLQPRRLFDFVSPKLVGWVFFMIVASISFDFFINWTREPIQEGWVEGPLFRTITLLVMNLFFGVIIYCNLYGRKPDPHQDKKDRIKQIEITIRSLAYISIGASIYFILKEGMDDSSLNYLRTSLESLFCIVMGGLSLGSRLRLFRESQVNFDVYKADVPAT